MGNFSKNWKKIRVNYEQNTLKILKILRTASLGSNFTGSYKKRECNFEGTFAIQFVQFFGEWLRMYLCWKKMNFINALKLPRVVWDVFLFKTNKF